MNRNIAQWLLVFCFILPPEGSVVIAVPLVQASSNVIANQGFNQGATDHLGTTYYIANNGSNTNSGTSPNDAWRTIAKLNLKQTFSPGDRILFRGGDTFFGGLAIILMGTSNSPCLLGSYGLGSATLTAAETQANSNIINSQFFLSDFSKYTNSICHIINSEFFAVTNLNFIDMPGINYPGTNFVPRNASFGLFITSDTHLGFKYRSISVSGCTFKYSRMGIAVVANTDATVDGFDDLNVTHCMFDGTYCVGCFIVGFDILKNGPVDLLSNVYVGDNQFYHVYGNPNEPSEAQPLYVGSATGVLIERNVFGDNCGYGGALKGIIVGGSTAFSVSNCRNFTMQYNEVYGTKCVYKCDGSAIDIDQDSQNGEVCYNLTYNNEGPAIQLGSFGGTMAKNIAIHHNISYDDARGCKNDSVQGAIRLWGNSDHIQVFNNSVYLEKSGSIGTPSCFNVEGGNNNNLVVLNNIFKTTQGIPMIRPNGSAGGEYSSNNISSTTKFLGNCYDSSGDQLIISTDDTHGNYTNITTLVAWRAVGQEIEGSKLDGIVADAGFTALNSFKPPAGGFLVKADSGTMTNFDLSGNSSCLGRAIAPSPFVTLQPPMSLQNFDYHGKPGPTVDIGAVQTPDGE